MSGIQYVPELIEICEGAFFLLVRPVHNADKPVGIILFILVNTENIVLQMVPPRTDRNSLKLFRTDYIRKDVTDLLHISSEELKN
jgi:hypothetical protein